MDRCIFFLQLSTEIPSKGRQSVEIMFTVKIREMAVLPWEIVMTELRLKAASMGIKSPNKFQGNNVKRHPFRPMFCYTFNKGQKCNSYPCKFSHTCQVCNGPHPRIRCTGIRSNPTSPHTNQPSKIQNYITRLWQTKINFIVSGFTFGFRLGCTKNPFIHPPHNHKSTHEHPDIVEDYINAGLSKERISGPFPYPPIL